MTSDFAVAVAPVVTDRTPKSFEKKPGAGRETFTVMLSLVDWDVENVIAPLPRPPFFDANCCASVFAVLVSGSDGAPASAAASAVDCVDRFARYHEPTSSTSAAIPSRTTRKTRVMTVDWPFWFSILIRLA